MLKVLRDNLKNLSWVLWLVILVFILLVFVDFGGTVPGGNAGTAAAVQVGNQEISYGEFESAYRRLEGIYRQSYGDNFNADFARQIGLPRQVLDSLISDRILLMEAEQMGLSVTDDELQSQILSLPVFQAPEGGFIGTTDYERILRSNGLTVDTFEASLRQDVLLSKVRGVLASNFYVSDQDVEEEYRRRVERAKIRFVKAPFEVVAGEVEMDEAEVTTYYEENQDDFRTPERRVADYLVVDLEQVRSSLVIDEADLQAYYDANQDQYTVDEQVRARHILLQVNDNRTAEAAEAELQAVSDRLAAGEPFAALAAEVSEDPGSKSRGGDLGFFGRGAMVEAFENAAFSATPGDIVGPIRTDFGYHLIEVLEKTDGGLRPFADVRAGIEQNLGAEKAREAAEAKAQELSSRLAGGAETGLAAVAETEEAVSFQTTPAFALEENIPGIGRTTPFATAVFGLALGETSEPTRISRGWAIARLTDLQEPRTPPLEEIFDEVRSALEVKVRREQALDLLAALATEGPDRIAAEFDLEVEETDSFGWNGTAGSLGRNQEIVEAALAAEEGTFGGPVETENAAVVFEVVERTGVDPVEFEAQKETTRNSLEGQRGARMMSALVASRREEIKVSVDPQLLANFGIDESEAPSS